MPDATLARLISLHIFHILHPATTVYPVTTSPPVAFPAVPAWYGRFHARPSYLIRTTFGDIRHFIVIMGAAIISISGFFARADATISPASNRWESSGSAILHIPDAPVAYFFVRRIAQYCADPALSQLITRVRDVSITTSGISEASNFSPAGCLHDRNPPVAHGCKYPLDLLLFFDCLFQRLLFQRFGLARYFSSSANSTGLSIIDRIPLPVPGFVRPAAVNSMPFPVRQDKRELTNLRQAGGDG